VSGHTILELGLPLLILSIFAAHRLLAWAGLYASPRDWRIFGLGLGRIVSGHTILELGLLLLILSISAAHRLLAWAGL
jgi:hypothetical protein